MKYIIHVILASADTSQEKYLHVNHHITSNFISVFKPYLDLGGAETSATATYASFVCAPSLVILEDFVLCSNIKCYRAVAFITSSTRLFTTVVNGLVHSFANYPWCLLQLMLYIFFFFLKGYSSTFCSKQPEKQNFLIT